MILMMRMMRMLLIMILIVMMKAYVMSNDKLGALFLCSEVCSSKAVFLFIVFETLDNTWVVGGAKSLLVV